MLINFKYIFFVQFITLCGDVIDKNGDAKIIANPENRILLDIKKLSPAELDKLNAFDVLFAGFKNNSKTNDIKKIEAKIAFLLKKPFLDLLYDVQLWHADGINELAYLKAVKEIQKKFGEKIDGNLTYSQFNRLDKIAEIYKTPKETYVGGNFRVTKFGDKAFVTGTLEIVNEDIANPINYHSMVLDKNSKVCRDSNLYVQETDGFAGGIAIYLDETNYDIVSWDEDEVICKKDYTCRSEKVIVNFKSKSVDIITTNREDEECKDFPRLKSARVSKLVDPFDTRMAINGKNEKLTQPFVADSAKLRLEEMFGDK